MKLELLLQKSCLVGLSYFDQQGKLMNHVQHAGSVIHVDSEMGISIKISGSSDSNGLTDIIETDSAQIFVIPSTPTAWFIAPEGVYRDGNDQILIKDPDYFVAWDIHLTELTTPEEQLHWWEWRPQTIPPSRANLGPVH